MHDWGSLTIKTWLDLRVEDEDLRRNKLRPNKDFFEYFLEDPTRLRKAHCFTTYIKDTEAECGRFNLSRLPGNYGVLVIHGVEVDPDYQGYGFGKDINRFIYWFSQETKHSALMATTHITNVKVHKCMETIGLEPVQNFYNAQTRRHCVLHFKCYEG
jgi:RimJ/RimL family protein N-acetyltransferase